MEVGAEEAGSGAGAWVVVAWEAIAAVVARAVVGVGAAMAVEAMVLQPSQLRL